MDPASLQCQLSVQPVDTTSLIRLHFFVTPRNIQGVEIVLEYARKSGDTKIYLCKSDDFGSMIVDKYWFKKPISVTEYQGSSSNNNISYKIFVET